MLTRYTFGLPYHGKELYRFDQTIDGLIYVSILMDFLLFEFVLLFLMVMLPEGDYWFMQKFPELRSFIL